MIDKTYILYKIYYNEILVYIGRTTQDLKDRLRMHFFHTNKIVKQLNLLNVTKIEYCILNTQADMFLYEIYLINLYHPILNIDDKAKDNLSDFITLPILTFQVYEDKIIEKWKEKLVQQIITKSDYSDDFFI